MKTNKRLQEYLAYQVDYHEWYCMQRGRDRSLSVIERLFVMAFETSKVTEEHVEYQLSKELLNG